MINLIGEIILIVFYANRLHVKVYASQETIIDR